MPGQLALEAFEADPSHRLRLGAGWRLGSLYERLGSVAVPGGSCPTVGLAGYTLGGGYGFLSRALGLGCDTLRAADIVTPDGELRTVGGGDQLWALRGAGGGQSGGDSPVSPGRRRRRWLDGRLCVTARGGARLRRCASCRLSARDACRQAVSSVLRGNARRRAV